MIYRFKSDLQKGQGRKNKYEKESFKMMNKKLVTTLVACALVGVVGVGGTFAYLTANTNEVQNTFTIGSVHFDLDNGLDESLATRDDSGVYQLDTTDRRLTQEYADILPGETVVKDPTIHMADDSEMAWVFAEVKYDPTQVASINYNTAEWTVITDITLPAGRVILYHNSQLGKYVSDVSMNDSKIFTSVTFEDMDNDTVINSIDIDAFAIQASAYATPMAAYSANEVVFAK